MTMAQKYYCSDCGDFSADREYPKTEDGFPDIPLCKSCGTECTDLTNDSRMGDLALLVQKLGKTRLEYESRIQAVNRLADKIKKDWGVDKL